MHHCGNRKLCSTAGQNHALCAGDFRLKTQHFCCLRWHHSAYQGMFWCLQVQDQQ